MKKIVLSLYIMGVLAIIHPCFLRAQLQLDYSTYFGGSGDTPVPGDYIWYGRESKFAADIAIFRPATGLWTVRGRNRYYFGSTGDIPLSGKFSGGSLEKTGIFQGSSGLWAIRGVSRVYFGTAGDLPVTR